jgi:hypothetical protein
MSRSLIPTFLVAAVLTGCSLSPVARQATAPTPSINQAAIEQAIHKEVTYLLSGSQATLESAAEDLTLAPLAVSAGDTVLSLLREVGGSESLFYRKTRNTPSKSPHWVEMNSAASVGGLAVDLYSAILPMSTRPTEGHSGSIRLWRRCETWGIGVGSSP